MLPFIAEHYSDDHYLFWPDLASSHYAKAVVAYLNEKNIKFVTKEDNPPNLPECRTIEDFWSYLKGLVYEGNWQAENVIQLRSRIKRCLKKVNFELKQSLAQLIPSHLDFIRRKGLIEDN